jgi:hypothetical protein
MSPDGNHATDVLRRSFSETLPYSAAARLVQGENVNLVGSFLDAIGDGIVDLLSDELVQLLVEQIEQP